MRSIKLLYIALLAAALASCKKDQPQAPAAPDTLKNGMLVLNEGLFQLNNSSLTWYDLSSGTANNEFFTQKAGRLLGDTGNDMQRYGGKIYIVVNVSSTIEVLDAATGHSIRQIQMISGSTSKQPRNLAFYGSKVFISCFDGFVDVMDTVSLTITQRIPVGLNPESMTVSGQKLFVSNSGGLNAPVMDSTVSVIDAVALSEIARVNVGKNPGSIVTGHQGDVYVIARGNYGSIPSRMKKIDAATLSVTGFPFEASGIERMGNKLLISYSASGTSQVALFNADTGIIENASFLDLGNVQTLYNIIYRPSDQQIYVLDAMGYTNTGYVRAFGATGNYITSYHVGLNPNSIVFYE